MTQALKTIEGYRDSTDKDDGDPIVLDIRPMLDGYSEVSKERLSVFDNSPYGNLTHEVEDRSYDSSRGYIGTSKEGASNHRFSISEKILAPPGYLARGDQIYRILQEFVKEDQAVSGDDEFGRSRISRVHGAHLGIDEFLTTKLIHAKVSTITDSSDIDSGDFISISRGREELKSLQRARLEVKTFNDRSVSFTTRFEKNGPEVEISLRDGLIANKNFKGKKDVVKLSIVQLAAAPELDPEQTAYNPDTAITYQEFNDDIAKDMASWFGENRKWKPLGHNQIFDKRRVLEAEGCLGLISTVFMPSRLTAEQAEGYVDSQRHLKDQDGRFKIIQSRTNLDRQKEKMEANEPARNGLFFYNPSKGKAEGCAWVEYVGEPVHRGVDPPGPNSFLTEQEQLYNFTAMCQNYEIDHPERTTVERHFLKLLQRDPSGTDYHRYVMVVRFEIEGEVAKTLQQPENDLGVVSKRVPKDIKKYIEHYGADTHVGARYCKLISNWLNFEDYITKAYGFFQNGGGFTPYHVQVARINKLNISDEEKTKQKRLLAEYFSIDRAYLTEEFRNLPKSDQDREDRVLEWMKNELQFLPDDCYLNDESDFAKEIEGDENSPFVLECFDEDTLQSDIQIRNYYPGMVGRMSTDGRAFSLFELDAPQFGVKSGVEWSDQKNNLDFVRSFVNRFIVCPDEEVERTHVGCTPYAEVLGVDNPSPYMRTQALFVTKDKKVDAGEKRAPDYYIDPWAAQYWEYTAVDPRSAAYAPPGSILSRTYRKEDGTWDLRPEAFIAAEEREREGLLPNVLTSADMARDSINENIPSYMGITSDKGKGIAFADFIPGVDPHTSPRKWNWLFSAYLANWCTYRDGDHGLPYAEIFDGEYWMSYAMYLYGLGAAPRGEEEFAFGFHYFFRYIERERQRKKRDQEATPQLSIAA